MLASLRNLELAATYCRVPASRNRSSAPILWSTSLAAAPVSICTLVDLRVELVALRPVVRRPRLTRVAPDIHRLVHREEVPVRALEVSLADLLAVRLPSVRLAAQPAPPRHGAAYHTKGLPAVHWTLVHASSSLPRHGKSRLACAVGCHGLEPKATGGEPGLS